MRLGKSFRKILFYAILILLTFIIQTSVFPLIPLLVSVPNLMLVLVFSIGFVSGRMTGMFCGLFAGLLMDLFYSGTFGFYSLFYLFSGYINGVFSSLYYNEYIGLPVVMCTLNELCYHLYIYVIRFLVRGRLDLRYYVVRIMLPETLFSIIITIIVYRFLLKSGNKISGLSTSVRRRLV